MRGPITSYRHRDYIRWLEEATGWNVETEKWDNGFRFNIIATKDGKRKKLTLNRRLIRHYPYKVTSLVRLVLNGTTYQRRRKHED